MAPAVITKKSQKPKEKKIIEKPIAKTKKIKKKSYHSFSIYIYKILRSVAPANFGISRKTMLIMNNFVNDMLERIASEAGKLLQHGKKTTLSSSDIQSAVKLLIPGELARHANSEATKAVTLYMNSQTQQKK